MKLANNILDIMEEDTIIDFNAIVEGLRLKSQDKEYQAMLRNQMLNEKLADVERRIKKADIPEYFREKGFDDFQVTDDNKAAFDYAMNYLDNWTPKERRGFALFGDVGTGKTHLVIALLKEMIRRHGIYGKYAHVLTTFEMARLSFNTDQINPIPLMREHDLLILDDLGSERPTPWALEQVSFIVESRLSGCKPTIITSNASKWTGLYRMLTTEIKGDPQRREIYELPVHRIIDRLAEMCPVVTLSGDSRRGKK